VNHVGAARYLNTTAAQNAIAATVAAYPACPQGFSGPSIDCAIANGATITNFAQNGLDSGNVVFGGAAASVYGATPDTGAAFAGANPNVGVGKFILPVGRSGYDALQVVVQQQKAHPLPGIVSSNMQISYTLSRVVSSAGGGTEDQFFNSSANDNDNPNRFLGRSALDHTNELSFGGSLGIKYGLQIGLTGHFFSAPPSTLTLDALSGNTAQIFQTDVTGDGSVGDIVPGSQIGSYMHQIKGAGLNRLINTYNATEAGTLTPAGQALVAAGLFTQNELSAANAVQQPIALAPNNPLNNNVFRTFDFSASYPIRLTKLREGLSIVPGIAMYNVTNMSNFGNPGGTLLNPTDAGCTTNAPCVGTTEGYLNGPNVSEVQNANRVQRGSGTFDAGGPRTTEFQLKVTF
jgi:hypothetical protein